MHTAADRFKHVPPVPVGFSCRVTVAFWGRMGWVDTEVKGLQAALNRWGMLDKLSTFANYVAAVLEGGWFQTNGKEGG